MPSLEPSRVDVNLPVGSEARTNAAIELTRQAFSTGHSPYRPTKFMYLWLCHPVADGRARGTYFISCLVRKSRPPGDRQATLKSKVGSRLATTREHTCRTLQASS